MNGAVIQSIALALYGNAYLKHNYPIDDFWQNSVFQFCAKTDFVTFSQNGAKKLKEILAAKDPIEWIKSSKGKFESFGLEYISSGMANEQKFAGFIGGGGTRFVVRSDKTSSEYWTAKWEVTNQNDPQRKIWSVTYGLIKTERKRERENDKNYKDRLYNALVNIRDFAEKIDEKHFARCFQKALETIDARGKVKYSYHTDLTPSCYDDTDIGYLLDACQSAWVFGGMGSWNDTWVEKKFQEEYEAVSAELYSSISKTIDGCVNSVNDK
jgi:hypothetical protein